MTDSRPHLDRVISDIRALTQPIADVIQPFRVVVSQLEKDVTENKLSAPLWVVAAHTDALVRVRIFTEQNFTHIETMGLLAVARYLFELVVWLKLMHMDERYGFVYYHELCRKLLRQKKDAFNHLQRECELLRAIGDEEDGRIAKRAELGKLETLGGDLHQISDEANARIDRAFTIFGEDAKRNGFGFQASLIKTKKLPEIQRDIEAIREQFEKFETLPSEVRRLFPKPRDEWKWRQKAALVSMADEYDFIYTYASRLLHATPVSLSTDEKNLEAAEMLVFLRYCRVRIRDILYLASTILNRYHSSAADATPAN